MPLTLAEVGEENIIKRVSGKSEVRTHLENLGFVAGSKVTIICKHNSGDIIVKVKDARIAISKEMACKIFV